MSNKVRKNAFTFVIVKKVTKMKKKVHISTLGKELKITKTATLLSMKPRIFEVIYIIVKTKGVVPITNSYRVK